MNDMAVHVKRWVHSCWRVRRHPASADRLAAFRGTSMATERELVKLPSGVSLETKLHSPATSTSEASAGLAVLLHPWSWLGGRMEDQCGPSLITPVDLTS